MSFDINNWRILTMKKILLIICLLAAPLLARAAATPTPVAYAFPVCVTSVANPANNFYSTRLWVSGASVTITTDAANQKVLLLNSEWLG